MNKKNEESTSMEKRQEDQNLELKIIREVNFESEDLYQEVIKLGDHAAHAIAKDHRSQMTGLEEIAESTLQTSNIFDYIKRQTARFDYWRKPFAGKDDNQSNLGFGERLKTFFEDRIARKRETIAKRLDIGNISYEDKMLRNRIYLLLIRQCIRHLVIQYEYRVSFEESKKGA